MNVTHLVDTDWAIHYLHGRQDIMDRLEVLKHEGLGLSIISLAELYEGIYYSRNPLAFGISVIYKALRMQSLQGFWRHVTVMTTQIVVAMIALAVALTVFVIFVVPMLPVR